MQTNHLALACLNTLYVRSDSHSLSEYVGSAHRQVECIIPIISLYSENAIFFWAAEVDFPVHVKWYWICLSIIASITELMIWPPFFEPFEPFITQSQEIYIILKNDAN